MPQIKKRLRGDGITWHHLMLGSGHWLHFCHRLVACFSNHLAKEMIHYPPGNEKTYPTKSRGSSENHRLKSAGWDGDMCDRSLVIWVDFVDILL